MLPFHCLSGYLVNMTDSMEVQRLKNTQRNKGAPAVRIIVNMYIYAHIFVHVYVYMYIIIFIHVFIYIYYMYVYIQVLTVTWLRCAGAEIQIEPFRLCSLR